MIVPCPAPPLRVAVVGAGTLGLTAVHAALAAGFPVDVVVRDRTGGGQVLSGKRAAVAASLDREVRRGALPVESAADLIDRLHVTTDPAVLGSADLVIEAVPEELATKHAVIAAIEAQVPAACVIASTTSSIPAGQLAAGARYPERIVVAHYVWPAHRMPLVEVAMHDHTSEAASGRLAQLLYAQRKAVVRVADRPGFLITRALLAYWDAAVQLVVDGLEAVEVDGALEGFGWPIGPLRLMDATSLGTAAAVHRRLIPALGDRFPALDRLQVVLDRGLSGFYDHGSGGRRPIPATAAALRGDSVRRPAGRDGEVVERAVGALAHEVESAVEEGVVASWAEAGCAIDLAYGFPVQHGGLHSWWSHRSAAPTLLSAAS